MQGANLKKISCFNGFYSGHEKQMKLISNGHEWNYWVPKTDWCIDLGPTHTWCEYEENWLKISLVSRMHTRKMKLPPSGHRWNQSASIGVWILVQGKYDLNINKIGQELWCVQHTQKIYVEAAV